jgi:hypothetical protein
LTAFSTLTTRHTETPFCGLGGKSKRNTAFPYSGRKVAQKLIEEAKEEANKNPEDALCRCISELAESLESKGLPGCLRDRHAGSLLSQPEGSALGRGREEDIQPDQALTLTRLTKR